MTHPQRLQRTAKRVHPASHAPQQNVPKDHPSPFSPRRQTAAAPRAAIVGPPPDYLDSTPSPSVAKKNGLEKSAEEKQGAKLGVGGSNGVQPAKAFLTKTHPMTRRVVPALYGLKDAFVESVRRVTSTGSAVGGIVGFFTTLANSYNKNQAAIDSDFKRKKEQVVPIDNALSNLWSRAVALLPQDMRFW